MTLNNHGNHFQDTAVRFSIMPMGSWKLTEAAKPDSLWSITVYPVINKPDYRALADLNMTREQMVAFHEEIGKALDMTTPPDGMK